MAVKSISHSCHPVAISFERAGGRTCVPVAYAYVGYDFAKFSGFGCHVEIEQMSLSVFYSVGYARGAVLLPSAGHRKLAAFLVRWKQPFLRMKCAAGVPCVLNQYVIF